MEKEAFGSPNFQLDYSLAILFSNDFRHGQEIRVWSSVDFEVFELQARDRWMHFQIYHRFGIRLKFNRGFANPEISDCFSSDVNKKKTTTGIALSFASTGMRLKQRYSLRCCMRAMGRVR